MTVDELMRYLSDFPPDARVVVSGYEGDADDPLPPVFRRVLIGRGLEEQTLFEPNGYKTVPAVSGMGVHELVSMYDDTGAGVPVVFIARYRPDGCAG